MGEESQMSQMSQVSEMSGMESSAAPGEATGSSKLPYLIAVGLLLLIGISIGAYLLLGSGGEQAAGANDDSSGSGDTPSNSGYTDVPAPAPPAPPAAPTTPPPPPPKVPPHFVMCVVGLHFRDPDRFKDLPCDFFIFGTLLPVDGHLMPTNDLRAWKAFKELQSITTTSCGFSVPGQQVSNLPKELPSAATDVKALFTGGTKAAGLFDLTINLDEKKATKKSLRAIFKVFKDAAKGMEDRTTLFLGVIMPSEKGSNYGDVAALLSDFMTFVDVLVFQTHITPSGRATPIGDCRVYPASSWATMENQTSFDRAAKAMKMMKGPLQHVAVSFTMGVTAFAVDPSTDAAKASWGAKCVYNDLFSYEDFCHRGVTTTYSSSDMTVRAAYKSPPAVLSLDTVDSATGKLKKLWAAVKTADICTVLVDIQLDDIRKCTKAKAFDRVTKISDATHAQPPA